MLMPTNTLISPRLLHVKMLWHLNSVIIVANIAESIQVLRRMSYLLPCTIFREDWNRGSASTIDPDTLSSTDDPTVPTPRSLSLRTWRSESASSPDQQRETKASVDATYNAVPLHETSRCTNPVISMPPDRRRPHQIPSADVSGHTTDSGDNKWLIFHST